MTASTLRAGVRRPRLLLAVGITAVLVLTGCSGDDGDSNGAGGTRASAATETTAEPAKPMPSESAERLVLPESAFPSLPGGDFELTTGPDDEDDEDDVTISPAACQKFDEAANNRDDRDRDRAVRSLERDDETSFTSVAYEATVSKDADISELDEFEEVFAQCREFTMTFGDGSTIELNLDRLDAGLDGDARAYLMTGEAEIMGIAFTLRLYMLAGVERECGFAITYAFLTADGDATGRDDVEGNLTRMYNEQRQRILDAA